VVPSAETATVVGATAAGHGRRRGDRRRSRPRTRKTPRKLGLSPSPSRGSTCPPTAVRSLRISRPAGCFEMAFRSLRHRPVFRLRSTLPVWPPTLSCLSAGEPREAGRLPEGIRRPVRLRSGSAGLRLQSPGVVRSPVPGSFGRNLPFRGPPTRPKPCRRVVWRCSLSRPVPDGACFHSPGLAPGLASTDSTSAFTSVVSQVLPPEGRCSKLPR
jgi:hypothetical protein